MKNYVGITIGPIVDTLMDASSPTALWFASSLFSDVSRRICSEIKSVFEDAEIYSPYFSPEIPKDDGVGKFHDRIIFSTKQYDSEKMKIFISKIKTDTKGCFPERLANEKTISFLKQYLQIHYVALEEDEAGKRNSILALSPHLDILELMRSFPADNDNNIIRRLFCGVENGGNIYVKESPLFQEIEKDNNQLKKNNSGLWTVEEIACDHGQITDILKRKHYYAVVQADGDNIGKFLETLDDNDVTQFSKACLEYDKRACEKIGDFGGMTIYAGGDDLLFLAPVINVKGESVFDLCFAIGELFRSQIKNVDLFKDNPCIPTVSFGIAIQHKKYPLYEAFSRSRELLKFVKKEKKSQKNSMAIEVLKHSGKSLKVIVSNEEYGIFQRVLALGSEGEKTVHSIIYTLQKFENLIFILNLKLKAGEISEDAYTYAFLNLFDNAEQQSAQEYIKSVCDIYRTYFVIFNSKIYILQESNDDSSIEKDTSLKTYLRLLLIKKFLLEEDEK